MPEPKVQEDDETLRVMLRAPTIMPMLGMGFGELLVVSCGRPGGLRPWSL